MSSIEKTDLKEFLKAIGEEETREVFKKFHCRDEEINIFLNTKAIEYEKADKARTYLFVDNENGCVAGFFSIANQSFEVPEKLDEDKVMSIRQRKMLDGFMGKQGNKVITHFPVYLIGQLARDEKYTQDELSGAVLLDTALDMIAEAQKIVGGRTVLVECQKELIPFYIKHGFDEDALKKMNPQNDKYRLIKHLGTYIVKNKKS